MLSGITCAAAAYCAGVFMSLKFDISHTAMFLAVFFAVCLVMRVMHRPLGKTKIIVTTAFFLGVVLTQYYSSPHMQAISSYDEKYVTLTGRISEPPENYGDNYRYTVDVRIVTADGISEKIRARMFISSPQRYEFGDTVDFSGFVREISGKLNENGFDLKRYYKSKEIFYRCYAYKSQPSRVTIKDYSVYAAGARLRNSISRLLDKYTYNDKGAVLKAIITGDKKSFSDEFGAVLTRTGTMRFFYPAFIHIMLIAAFFTLFASVVPRRLRDAAMAAALIIYAVIQSAHPVMVKGCLTAAFLIFFRRRLGYVYFSDVLGAVVLVVAIANPLILYNAGFVTGTAASLLISVFYAPVMRAVKIKNGYVKKVIVMGIICTVGLIPLSAFYFNGISLYSIVTALVFVPATAAVLILSPLLLIMLALFGSAPVVGELVTFFIWIYMKLPYITDALPFSYIALPKVDILTILAFYAGVFGVHMLFKRRKYNAFLAFCAAASLFAVTAAGELSRFNKAEFTFVNVGQGDGALIRVPHRTTVLMDGGGASGMSDYDAGENVYVPYLESLGISRADCAVVSHCHGDHALGIIAAMKTIGVRHVYLPETDADNEVYAELIKTAEKYGTEAHIVKDAATLRFKSGLIVKLYPSGDNALLDDDDNDKSLLARVSYGDTDCLFTGDMPKAEEYGLLSAGIVEKAEILKVAHHGSDTSTSAAFLNAVSPDYAVISVGEDNSYNLPSEAVLARLKGVKVLRTDENGDITITAGKNGITKIHTYK